MVHRLVEMNPRLEFVRGDVDACTSIGEWIDFWEINTQN